MNRLYKTAQNMGFGIVETFEYMVARCHESYTVIWDFIIDKVE